MQEEFKIFLQETRVYRNQDGEMIFEGTASSDTIDSHRTRFNAAAQEGFMFDIMKGMEDLEPVELEAEHKGEEEPMNILGPVIMGMVSPDNKLTIRARLDQDNPKAVYYFNKMTKPDPVTKKVRKFGLSINGIVEKAHYEYDQEAGQHIEVFDRVRLKRIGIVRKPSNPDCWVEKIIRSVNWDEVAEALKPTHNQERLTNEMKNNESVTQELETEMETVRSDSDSNAVADAVEVVNADVTEVREQVQHEDLADDVTQVTAGEGSAECKSENCECGHAECDKAAQRKEEVEIDAKADAGVEVNRTSYWVANTLLEAMEEVSEALCTLEYVTECDGEMIDAGMGQDCVDAGKNLLNKMMRLFGDHVNTTRSDENADADQSAADEAVVGNVDAVDTVDAEKPADLVDDVDDTVAEERKDNSNGVDAEQIIRAVSDMLDNDYAERLVARFEESQKTALTLLDAKLTELANGNTELVRSLDEVKAENAKLVTRLAEIEKLPASRPGAQLIENVSRAKIDSDKKAENLNRAQTEGDTNEIFRHKVYGNAYLGYGEYAKL
jgi:hypothetical protein